MKTPEAEKTTQRARRVYGRWPLGGQRWWDADLSEYALWLGGGFLLLSLVAEISLTAGGFELLYFSELASSGPRRGVLAGIFLFNAWLLDASLTVRTPGRATLVRGDLVWRRLLLLLPLLRLYAIPLRRSVPARPEADPVAHPLLHHGDRSRRLSGLSSRLVQSQVLVIGWLFASELLVVFGTVCWLAHPGFAASRTTLWILSMAFHLLAAGNLGIYSFLLLRERRLSSFQVFPVALLPAFSLLPFLVGPILAALCWASVNQLSQETTLSELPFRQRGSVQRLPTWIRLQEALRPGRGESWWGNWWKPLGLASSEEESLVEQQLRSLYRLKALFLSFDAAALVWLGARLVGAGQIAAWLSAALPSCLAVAGLGALVALLDTGGRILRLGRKLPGSVREPFGRYLLLGPLLALAGADAALLVREEGPQLGLLLSQGGMIGFFALAVATCGLAMTVGLSKAAQSVATLYLFVFLAVTGSGIVLFLAPEGASRLEPIFWLGTVGGICLSFTATPWLLRPFRGRQVFSCELPVRRRVALGFLILTTALPLGGLAIPLWLLVRRSLAVSTARK